MYNLNSVRKTRVKLTANYIKNKAFSSYIMLILCGVYFISSEILRLFSLLVTGNHWMLGDH